MKNLLLTFLLTLAVFAVGCSGTESANSNVDSNTAAEAVTKPAPDNSEVTTRIDANGVKTEERVFKNNPRVARVVVTTTKDGQRTVKAYSPSGEEREVKSTTENVLDTTGDAIADSVGFVADKAEDVAGETKDAAGEVKDKTVEGVEKAADTTKKVGSATVEGAKKVGDTTAEGAKKVGDTTVEGAKKVGDKTVEGAKKAGKAVKKIVP